MLPFAFITPLHETLLSLVILLRSALFMLNFISVVDVAFKLLIDNIEFVDKLLNLFKLNNQLKHLSY